MLFADPYQRGSPDRIIDVSPRTGDLVAVARAGSKRDRIVVVTGWLDELRQRMAARQLEPSGATGPQDGVA